MTAPTDPTSSTLPTADAPVTAPVSRWEDFVDIFYAPAAVYERRRHSGFGIPMLVVTVVTGAIILASWNALSPMLDAEFSRRMASMSKQGITPEQAASGRAIAEKIGRIGAVIGPPILIFVTGFVLWLCGKLVNAKESLTAAIMVTAYANVPRLLNSVLAGAQALLMDPASLNGRYRITLSGARFLDPDTASPVLLALGGRLDLFTLWVTALLAIGLSVTGRIPRSKALLAAGLVWVLGSLPDLLGALQQR
jgi:hypothetical protein